jgi:hypothetical protein
MTISNYLNIIGLVFDLIGVIMLFRFGLPPDITRSGSVYLIAEQEDPIEKDKAKKFERLSWIALIAIIIGFSLQIVANLTPLFKNE